MKIIHVTDPDPSSKDFFSEPRFSSVEPKHDRTFILSVLWNFSLRKNFKRTTYGINLFQMTLYKLTIQLNVTCDWGHIPIDGSMFYWRITYNHTMNAFYFSSFILAQIRFKNVIIQYSAFNMHIPWEINHFIGNLLPASHQP